jgi:antitoxin component of MazEF toxin-antitoxin module
MERPYPSVEFEGKMGEHGVIVLPKHIAAKFNAGQEITVKVTEGTVSDNLRRRNVTEEGIEHIALMQLEQREHVLRFLEAEGALAGRGSFAKRAVQYLRRKR